MNFCHLMVLLEDGDSKHVAHARRKIQYVTALGQIKCLQQIISLKGLNFYVERRPLVNFCYFVMNI